MKRGRKVNQEARKYIRKLLQESLKNGIVTREDLWKKFKNSNVECSKSLFLLILDEFERRGEIKKEVIYRWSKVIAYKPIKWYQKPSYKKL